MTTRRAFFVPEVVQTSAMDCGPAALAAFLGGHGLPISYGRLRDACQTDVDGTSIEALERVSTQLGVPLEQAMIPNDHLGRADAPSTPVILLLYLPGGLAHFAVLWSRRGRFLQLMDPAVGRVWSTVEQVRDRAWRHEQRVPAAGWAEWAYSEAFLPALRGRIRDLGLDEATATRLTGDAPRDGEGYEIAALDAATRMTEALRARGGVERGAACAAVLERIWRKACDAPRRGGPPSIPEPFWFARFRAARPDDDEPMVELRGVLMLRPTDDPSAVEGRVADAATGEGEGVGEGAAAADADLAPADALSPERVAALREAPGRPLQLLLHHLFADGKVGLAALLAMLLLAATGVVVEAVLLRGFVELGGELGLAEMRTVAVTWLVLFLVGLLLVDLVVARSALRVGRRLENRLRMAFLRKLRRLGDRYFSSRPASDMAERSHTSHLLRQLPDVCARVVRLVFELVLTAAGIAWLDPASAPYAFAIALVAIGVPLLAYPLLAERSLRFQTHLGALSRFFLDALLGLVMLRAHGAEPAMRQQHELLLVDWSRAGRALHRASVVADAVQALVITGLTFAMLWSYLLRTGEAGGMLLIVYWSLALPIAGQQLAVLMRQLPHQRSLVLRTLEPLDAPDRGDGTTTADDVDRSHASHAARGVEIALDGVTIVVAGHTILDRVDLSVAAGTHVAIVGSSGAGKSSLVGLLLGWHEPAAGRVLVDGVPLTPAGRDRLRRDSIWVDPEVYLWNRSMAANLAYGNDDREGEALHTIVRDADLLGLLEELPDGLQTVLGEGGGLVSGGEGQRVRFGRGLGAGGRRLVILDEPFRGLDRTRRRELLARARARWADATLLCVTHDVRETVGFDRVVVVEGGRIVEDGAPAALAVRTDSRYRELSDAEHMLDATLWHGNLWRRGLLAGGDLALEDEAVTRVDGRVLDS